MLRWLVASGGESREILDGSVALSVQGQVVGYHKPRSFVLAGSSDPHIRARRGASVVQYDNGSYAVNAEIISYKLYELT